MSRVTRSPETPTQMAAITVTPASVVPSGQAVYEDAIAYEAITQGQPLAYLDSGPFSGSNPSGLPTVRLADATAQYKVIGMAACAAQAGQPIKVTKIDPAMAINGVVAGDVLYLGVAPGAITITYADLVAGKYVAVLGVGIAAGKINMNIVRSDAPK